MSCCFPFNINCNTLASICMRRLFTRTVPVMGKRRIKSWLAGSPPREHCHLTSLCRLDFRQLLAVWWLMVSECPSFSGSFIFRGHLWLWPTDSLSTPWLWPEKLFCTQGSVNAVLFVLDSADLLTHPREKLLGFGLTSANIFFHMCSYIPRSLIFSF